MTLLRCLFLVLCLLGAPHSFAQIANSPNVAAPRFFDKLAVHFGNRPPSIPLPGPGLRLFVWNVHRGKDAQFVRDFGTYSDGIDVALFQEAVSDPTFTTQIVAANRSLGWTLAKSFSVGQESYTGVATGSRVMPAKEEVIISTPREPISNTHKTILISQYYVAFQAEPLLVANIHAINFVPTGQFALQIQQLVARVREHRGPLIIGGDFNTWHPHRMAYIDTEFSKLGLKWIYSPKYKFLNLDHIFVRGLKVQAVTNLDHIRSSDHSPMRVDLLFDLPEKQGPNPPAEPTPETAPEEPGAPIEPAN